MKWLDNLARGCYLHHTDKKAFALCYMYEMIMRELRKKERKGG